RDLMKDRPVALKVVSPPVDARTTLAYSRFVREARIAEGLHHPHIVETFDVEEAFGLLAMELMEGGTLRDELGRVGPLPLEQVRQVGIGVAGALELAHARGLIHRDVKPANLFLTSGMSSGVKLGDFGSSHLQSTGVTQTAGFIGTLAYMS